MVTTCFFCKKISHVKKDCPKYAKWHVNKGTLLNFVCSKVNVASIPKHTWWIEIGATTDVSVSLKGCLRSQLSTDAEKFIYVENSNTASVETIVLFRLQLETSFYLDLSKAYYVSSFNRI